MLTARATTDDKLVGFALGADDYVTKPFSPRELADAETVARCVSHLHNVLSESSLVERKSFIRSFVKEVKVTGEDMLLTYTIPMVPKGVTQEKLPVLSVIYSGGPQCTIHRTFELSFSLNR
jgi:CheY-like chemotaxis protein